MPFLTLSMYRPASNIIRIIFATWPVEGSAIPNLIVHDFFTQNHQATCFSLLICPLECVQSVIFLFFIILTMSRYCGRSVLVVRFLNITTLQLL